MNALQKQFDVCVFSGHVLIQKLTVFAETQQQAQNKARHYMIFDCLASAAAAEQFRYVMKPKR